MKRGLILIVFLLVFSLFYIASTGMAVDVNNLQDTAKDLEEVTDSVGNAVDNPKQEFDRVLNKTKAEERIDSINLWLEENAYWLKFIFRMQPEISWLFYFNIYYIFFFIIVLILNSNILNSFMSSSTAKLVGFGVFIVLLLTNVIFNMAKFTAEKVQFIVDYGWIGIILLIVVMVIILRFFPNLMIIIAKYFDERKKRLRERRVEEDQETLKEFTKSATEQN